MAHKDVLLKDYLPPVFLVDTVDLDFDIQPKHVRVTNIMTVRRNPASKQKTAALELKGEQQKLVSVSVNGKELTAKEYTLTDKALTIAGISGKATVEVISDCDPYNNTSMTGLYLSGPMLSTQCEPEGFRRFTYHPDRPDVMSKYITTIHADKKKYPTLLSNGNLVKAAAEGKSRHMAVWQDPFLKPAYLFAVVAGNLEKVSSSFKTKSKRNVLIEIYVEPGRKGETAVAMDAVKKSMKWDEETFGLEYDLDRFMVVGTPFFNMGAMENKGLNIFNDMRLLGTPANATDYALMDIERVVGHEYFHNWTGNRITCRDWFQLSLKEGLTVFREQEFCAAMGSPAVERLDSVRVLRLKQFAEDASAMAHPIRPDRYQEIDNFYTMTIYEKGSEVIRMIQTMVGVKGFRKGMDLYVKRHDGTAATCDDFVKAMADANKIDLSQFKLWYSQAGTPTLDITSKYDAKKQTLTLSVKQTVPATPGQKKKLPMHMPLSVGLLDDKGRDMIGTEVLHVKKAKQDFVLKGIKTKPHLSLLRDFSAPVYLNYPYSDDELLFLMAHDSDAFNRAEAGYTLATSYLLAMAMAAGKKPPIEKLASAFGDILHNNKIDPAFKALLLTLPSEGELGLAMRAKGKPIDVDAILAARKAMVQTLANNLRTEFEKNFDAHKGIKPLAIDGLSMGRRALKNLCLNYLAATGDKEWLAVAAKQIDSKSMTDQIATLNVFAPLNTPQSKKVFATFEKRWKKVPTTMDQWLTVQALAKRPDALANVKKLTKSAHFDIRNPNRFRSLLRAFLSNDVAFHAKDGAAYKYIADTLIMLDKINPHNAAFLAKGFASWRDYSKDRQKLMKAQLERLSKLKLSVNSAEIITKSLKG